MNNKRFKQTEIGEIPENWSFTPFREVAYLSKEVFDPKKAKQDESSVYLGLEHFCEGGFALNGIGQSDEIQSSKFRFVSGDVLFGKLRPYFKKVYSPKFDGVCSTDIWVLRAKQGVDQKFLYFLVGSDTFLNKAIESSEGTKMPRASWDFIANYRFPIPAFNEQQQIASILSSLDDKIELNKKMNKMLEEIGKALFKRWFVDFEFPNDDGKPYKSSGGEMADSEIGEIPKGWKIKPLRELVEYYVGGGWGSEQQNENHTIEAAVVRGTDIPAIKTGSYGSPPIRFHKESNYRSRVLEEGDIVFEVSGGSTDQPVGRSCLILDGLLNQYCNKPICASFCKLIRPIKDLGYLLQPSFELLYSTDEIYKYQEKSTGITNYKFEFFLDEYKLVLPLIPSLITQYISFSKSLNNRISVLSVENENLKKIRDSLLPRLMSGKLRVN